jgi:hypothetical protein
VNAIEAAVQKDRVVFVLAQRRPEVTDPAPKDLYRVGTVVRDAPALPSPGRHDARAGRGDLPRPREEVRQGRRHDGGRRSR